MTFAVTGVAFLSGLFRFRLLDLTPVAWAVVVKGMNDPVVVIDPEAASSSSTRPPFGSSAGHLRMSWVSRRPRHFTTGPS